MRDGEVYYMSATEFAEKIGQTRQAVCWQCRNKKLPEGWKAKRVGKTWLIMKSN